MPGFLIVIERSPESSKEVFVETSAMTKDQRKVYDQVASDLESRVNLPDNTVVSYIYIDTPAEVCSRRIN
jgi:hypothetical protein